jgi:hypothetical protein
VEDATKKMLDAARIGRLTANGPEAQAKRAIKARKNALWRSMRGRIPVSQRG